MPYLDLTPVTEIPARHAGAIYYRALDDGWEITVWRMAFNWRVCFGSGLGFEDAYCFADRGRALQAAMLWDGVGEILDGWHKQPTTGRRRPDGDPAREYTAP